VKRFIIHPSKVVESAAAFTHDVQVVRVKELRAIVFAVKGFFKSFERNDFRDLSPNNIQKMIDLHHLSVSDFQSLYSKKLLDNK
jgi:hypothetical protein